MHAFESSSVILGPNSLKKIGQPQAWRGPAHLARVGGTATGALALLSAAESEGLAIDFTVAGGFGSVAVRDAGTPANNKSNVAASAFLSNSSASVVGAWLKRLLQRAGRRNCL
jgi:hypothetical protein